MHVLGTAGHVDHGKSTLIERLTGIDPDRLAEEKERGLTIDLGFAWLELPSGREVGIVDVPGHERFVSNMLAGAGSIDATIFVVAANEGWQPQSEEHLAILDLLGARGGVVALTKCDLVHEEERATTARAVVGRLEGTVLDGAPIVPVSASTGSGLDALVGEIERLLDRTPQAEDRGRPRLFVDRSFSIKGAGTVVTGTLTGGTFRVEDQVAVLPGGGTARIRSIQTHKRKRDTAEPGSRVALNLGGLDRDEITRGDAVVLGGQWRPTDVLDVSVRTIRGLDRALSSRGAYKLHLGSAEVDARLRLLGGPDLRPSATGFARITLASPIVADAFDRFVLRDASRDRTVAGGEVLDPHPAHRRIGDPARREAELENRRAAGRLGLADAVISERRVVSLEDLRWLAGAVTVSEPLKGYAASAGWLADATERVTRALDEFHAANTLARGMPRDMLRAAAGFDDAKLFAALLAATPGIVEEGTLVRRADHRISLSPGERAARDAMIDAVEAGGFSPPLLGELAATHGRALVEALIGSGDLVQISRELALTQKRYEEAKSAIARSIREDGPATAARIRDVLGTSRKYLIPLLEHLDAVGFTKRSGDLRMLAGPHGGDAR